VKVVKPIVSALMDKHARSRTLMHDVPESEIPGVLSSCGIQKYMLPTQLERTVLLDQVKRIASQRAAELEDIWLWCCGFVLDKRDACFVPFSAVLYFIKLSSIGMLSSWFCW
jgi:hypothetical protein